MLTLYHVAVSEFDDVGRTLLRSTLSGVTLLVPPSLYDRLLGGGTVPDDFDYELRTVLEEHFLVPDRVADRAKVLGHIRDVAARTRDVSITLMTTGACNMACEYCFQNNLLSGQQHFPTHLAERFVEWTIDTVRRLGGRSLMLHLYGGEPLLNRPLIEAVTPQLHLRLKGRAQVAVSLTTNGSLLTPRTVDWLAALGCTSAIISLDGPPEVHDTRRPLKRRNTSSFDAVFAGIQAALRRFDVVVRTNIDRHNANAVEALIRRLAASDLICHPRFFHSLEVVGPVLCPTEHVKREMLDIAESGRVVAAGLEYQRRAGMRLYGNMPSEVSCEHIAEATFTVDHRGFVFPCPGFVGFEDYCIGHILKGVDETRLKALYNIRPWEEEPCVSCPFVPQCHGGCRSCAAIQHDDHSPTGGYATAYCRREFFEATFPAYLRAVYDRVGRARSDAERAPGSFGRFQYSQGLRHGSGSPRPD